MEVYAISFLFTDGDDHLKVDEGDNITVTMDCGSVIKGDLKKVKIPATSVSETITLDTEFESELELDLMNIEKIEYS